MKALTGEELTLVEQNRMGLVLQAIVTAHWQVYYQYENGFLDKEVFDAFERRSKDSRFPVDHSAGGLPSIAS